jgi:hypothetical protein
MGKSVGDMADCGCYLFLIFCLIILTIVIVMSKLFGII